MGTYIFDRDIPNTIIRSQRVLLAAYGRLFFQLFSFFLVLFALGFAFGELVINDPFVLLEAEAVFIGIVFLEHFDQSVNVKLPAELHLLWGFHCDLFVDLPLDHPHKLLAVQKAVLVKIEVGKFLQQSHLHFLAGRTAHASQEKQEEGSGYLYHAKEVSIDQ
jgi:hypothetical protein